MSFSTKTCSAWPRYTTWLWCLALLFAGPACGKKKHGKTRALDDEQSTQSDSDLDTIPDIQTGSYALAVLPEPGSFDGPVLLQLFAEEGAEIRYAPFGDIDWQNDAQVWNGAQLMYPPFEIHAQSWVNGKSGETYHFKFESKIANDASQSFMQQRRLGLNVTAQLREQVSQQLDISKLQIIDEDAGSSSVRDGINDLPQNYEGTNIVRSTVIDEGARWVLQIELSKPLKRLKSVAYGFDLSASGITNDSFGDGAKAFYRIECVLLSCGLFATDSTDRIAEIEVESANDPLLAMYVEKSWLDKSLQEQANIVFRAFTADSRRVGIAYDRTSPIYTQPSLTTKRTTIKSANENAIDLRILAQSGLERTEQIEQYLANSNTVTPLLERQNSFSLDTLGTIPLVMIPQGSKTFSGINSTERGILFGLSDNEQVITRFQLVAHELAHFQNAGLSRLSERWVQEGFSEWSAERAMYATFSRRAVYRYLRTLRVDAFVRLVKSGRPENDQPLSNWKSLDANQGYEKVAVFFQLLDREVGTDVLRQAQLIARNMPMDGDQFRRTLESLSGKDLRSLFQYWVNDLPAAEEFSAEFLLSDSDQDGLLKLDESMLGTSDNQRDTDGDGFSDLEEFLSEDEPTKNRWTDSIATYPQPNQPLSNMIRLGSGDRTQIYYSLNEEQVNGEQSKRYVRAMDLKGPVTIWATDKQNGTRSFSWNRTITDGQGVERPFAPVPVQEKDGLMSAQTSAPDLSSFKLETPQSYASSITDAVGDIPQSYASLDIAKIELEDDGAFYKFIVTSKGSFDRIGEFGKTEFLFSSQTFARDAFPTYHSSASFTAVGTQIIANLPTGLGSTKSLEQDVKLRISGRQLTMLLRKQKIESLLSSGTFSQVCIRTHIRTDDDQQLIDQAGCIPLRWSANKFKRVRFNETNGTPHTVDLFGGEGLTNEHAEELARATAASILHMAKLMGHPVDDRSYWQLHLDTSTQGELRTDFNDDFGIFVSSRQPDSSYPLAAYGNQVLALLARTIMLDIKERLGSEKDTMWVRESMIAWLRLSASQASFGESETRNVVRSFVAGHWLCYYNNGCFENAMIRRYYPSEARQGLSQWNSLYDETLSQQKVVMATMDLISIIGNQAFSRFAAVSFNSVSNAEQALSAIRALAPTKSSEILAWSNRWGLTNNGIDVTAIQALFTTTSENIYDVESRYRSSFP